jgi:hypothetical protein
MTDEENWRKAFEMIGPETLRLRLEHRRNEFSGPYARAAEIWLLEKAQASARIESARFSTIKRWKRYRGARWPDRRMARAQRMACAIGMTQSAGVTEGKRPDFTLLAV